MQEFLSKIENFIFDILGLILPGFIFLGILIIPLSIVNVSKISKTEIEASYILSELSFINTLFTNYWDEKSNIIIITIIIIAYLLGHFIKVFSIIVYEWFEALFDKTLNKLFAKLLDGLYWLIDYPYRRITGDTFDTTKVYNYSKDIYKPINNTISKVFVFKAYDYFTDNDSLKTECVQIINSRLGTSYPNKWYSIYKFSTVISSQENLKSLSSFFLAKYNLYRSLSIIFLFAGLYLHYFFTSLTSPSNLTGKISFLTLILTILLWFTFHYKYKRYWTLCGNETLVSLYYFLNKKKINV